jgi:hypothetical protein
MEVVMSPRTPRIQLERLAPTADGCLLIPDRVLHKTLVEECLGVGEWL